MTGSTEHAMECMLTFACDILTILSIMVLGSPAVCDGELIL